MVNCLSWVQSTNQQKPSRIRIQRKKSKTGCSSAGYKKKASLKLLLYSVATIIKIVVSVVSIHKLAETVTNLDTEKKGKVSLVEHCKEFPIPLTVFEAGIIFLLYSAIVFYKT